MNTVSSEMSVLRGKAIGNRAVMGKLVFPKKSELCSEFDKEEPWSIFSRALGILICRIEEGYEYLYGKCPEDIRVFFCNMLEITRRRDFLGEMRGVISEGYSVLSAIELLKPSYTEAVFFELYSAFENILLGYNEDFEVYSDSDIVFLEQELDALLLVAFAKGGVQGIICTGGSAFTEKLARALGISLLFIDKNIKCGACGEDAILFPSKNALYITPDISIIDEFSGRSEDDTTDIEKEFFGGYYTRYLRGVSGRYNMLKVELSSVSEGEEERYFELFRMFAEHAEGRETVICISGREFFEKHFCIFELFKAICRAAVYGRISAAFSVLSQSEYVLCMEALKEACDELSGQAREYDGDIDIGVIVESTEGIFLSRELSCFADFIVLDIDESIGNGMSELSFDYSEKLYKRISDTVEAFLENMNADLRISERL